MVTGQTFDRIFTIKSSLLVFTWGPLYTDMGVMPNASGVAVHDFWKTCQKYDNVDHAMCCAHLERELVYAYETGDQAWVGHLRELLQTLCHRSKVLQSEGKEAFTEQELAVYLERYDKLVDGGLTANPISERAPGKRGCNAKGMSSARFET